MGSPWNQKTTKPTGSGENGEYPVIPAGQYPAVLVAMVDIGHVEVRKYQSSEMEEVRKVVLVWELTEYNQPPVVRPVIGKDFRLSGHPKAQLRKFLEGWRGKAFGDSEPLFSLNDKGEPKILGQRCLLKVSNRASGDRTFHEVEAAALPVLGGKKIEVAAPDAVPFVWSAEGGKLGDLPDWLPYLYGKPIGDWASSSREQAGALSDDEEAGQEEAQAVAGGTVNVDDIPF